MSEEVQKWIKKVQKVLNQAPDGLGFFTIGDAEVTVYDLSMEDEINRRLDTGEASDFCVAVDNLDCQLGYLKFPNGVHSTAG